MGKDVPFPLLAAVAEMADEELRQAIAKLQTAEFLYERACSPISSTRSSTP